MKSKRIFLRAMHLVIFVSLLTMGCKGSNLLPPADSPPPVPSKTIIPTKVDALPTAIDLEQDQGFIPASERYTAVGLLPEQTLPIHQEANPSSPVIGNIPSGGMDILISQESDNLDQEWILIQYANLQGWVESKYLAIQQGTLPAQVAHKGAQILSALKERNYQTVIEATHPEQCLRFSPYQYLTESNLSFCQDELILARNDSKVYDWGVYDGRGDPIQLTFDEYHERFIYDLDFFHADIVGYNTEVSSGNAINNIKEIYPAAVFIEYHFPQTDSEYAGMDWRSLIVVFIEIDQMWYLAALVHGEWTI